MAITTTICRCCQRPLVFAEGVELLECSACFTVNARPQAEGASLEVLRRATEQRLRCDFHNAENSYQHVLLDFPEEHEALWGLALCRYGVEYVDDPASGRRMPVVHGVRRKPLQLDSDFQQACDLAPEAVRAQYEADAAYIDDAMAKIREMADACPPFDVFICHKTTKPGSAEYTEDYNRAFKLYHMLDKQGYRAFFAPMEMEGVSAGSDYEAGIYHALDTAKVMLVVCSDAEYLTSAWVRNEWSRFLEMADDRAGKGLLPLMYGGMATSRLPREFRVRKLQAVTMGELGSAEMVLNAVRRYAGSPRSAAPQPVLPPQPAPQPNPVPVAKKPEPQSAASQQPLPAPQPKSAPVERRPEPQSTASQPQPVPQPKASDVQGKTSAELTQVLRAVIAKKAIDQAKQTAAPASQTPAAETGYASENHFSTALTEGGLRITGYNGPGGKVLIPPQIGGRKVVEIGKDAFFGREQLTHLVIPDSVTSIGDMAFNGCRGLTNVRLPVGLTHIGDRAFARCSSLTGLSIPASVVSIGNYAFYDCSGLGSVVIPANITHIGEGLFYDCSGLTSVSIAKGILSIGNSAFNGCRNLMSVRIPESVKHIGDSAFRSCGMLEYASIPAGVTKVGEGAFRGCTKLPFLQKTRLRMMGAM